jgi:hypothetical protein
MAKAEFSKKRTLFNSKLDLSLSKNIKKCYIWNFGKWIRNTSKVLKGGAGEGCT